VNSIFSENLRKSFSSLSLDFRENGERREGIVWSCFFVSFSTRKKKEASFILLLQAVPPELV
jgi:hypothetical protein